MKDFIYLTIIICVVLLSVYGYRNIPSSILTYVDMDITNCEKTFNSCSLQPVSSNGTKTLYQVVSDK